MEKGIVVTPPDFISPFSTLSLSLPSALPVCFTAVPAYDDSMNAQSLEQLADRLIAGELSAAEFAVAVQTHGHCRRGRRPRLMWIATAAAAFRK